MPQIEGNQVTPPLLLRIEVAVNSSLLASLRSFGSAGFGFAGFDFDGYYLWYWSSPRTTARASADFFLSVSETTTVRG